MKLLTYTAMFLLAMIAVPFAIMWLTIVAVAGNAARIFARP